MTAACTNESLTTVGYSDGLVNPPPAPADTLAISSRDSDLWNDAVDALLGWFNQPEQFADEDRPTSEILESALDFAYDQRAESQPVPSSIVPSGNGRIAFEWNDGDETLSVEFFALGQAKVTRFRGYRVVQSGYLLRNPRTRKLELQPD